MVERCYYILAGEASADILAAQLMRALKKNSSEPINWIGIGGDQMEQLGLTSYRPISELSVIGILDAITSRPVDTSGGHYSRVGLAASITR